MKTKKASITLYFKEAGNSYFDDACERQALLSSRLFSFCSLKLYIKEAGNSRTLSVRVFQRLGVGAAGTGFNAEFATVLLLILQSRQFSACCAENCK